jgi:hypothetical protein
VVKYSGVDASFMMEGNDLSYVSRALRWKSVKILRCRQLSIIIVRPVICLPDTSSHN